MTNQNHGVGRGPLGDPRDLTHYGGPLSSPPLTAGHKPLFYSRRSSVGCSESDMDFQKLH